MSLRLNLGCGTNQAEGWVNVDTDPRTDPDQVVDLDEYPWPWETSTATTIVLDDVLEHLEDPYRALLAVHRVLEPGGRLDLAVPHHKDPEAYRLTHRTCFSEVSLRPLLEAEDGTRLAGEHVPAFRLEDLTVLHRHPLAWHQRRYLGREVLAWGPKRLEFTLTNRPTSLGSRPKGATMNPREADDLEDLGPVDELTTPNPNP